MFIINKYTSCYFRIIERAKEREINGITERHHIIPKSFGGKNTKDNLVNLILTKKGEREMQPDFGCDIHNLIFEQIVEESIATDIENSILDAVNIWLPYINVDNIIFDYDDNDIDTNRITLEVQFSLKSNPSLTETLNVSINN